MNILSIDTTGFSSSVALVKNGSQVLFNKISSGFIPHRNWWDFPYLLPVHHQKFLLKNLKDIRWKEIDAIAVSANSGIYTCILVGLSMAKVLADCYKKPIIEVDHILAHLYSPWLERDPNNFKFPILVFSASGSHSDFSLLKNKRECEIIYDTVPQQAKKEVKVFLGIGKIFYQMGKILNKFNSRNTGVDDLMKSARRGNPYKFDFTQYYKKPLLDLNFYDFMDSIDKFARRKNVKVDDVAASFQESINEIISNKIIKLAEIKKVREIHIAGGISENKHLERKLKEKIKEKELPFILRYPVKKEYRLDNAAMIGALAYYQKKYHIKFINFKPSITR
jgi:N6-L-threonylcarbamoyladenine synthase